MVAGHIGQLGLPAAELVDPDYLKDSVTVVTQYQLFMDETATGTPQINDCVKFQRVQVKHSFGIHYNIQ